MHTFPSEEGRKLKQKLEISAGVIAGDIVIKVLTCPYIVIQSAYHASSSCTPLRQFLYTGQWEGRYESRLEERFKDSGAPDVLYPFPHLFPV